MTRPIAQSKWISRCTNPNCCFSAEKPTLEPDVVCEYCGGFVAITEHITFVDVNYIQTEEKDDIRSN